MNQAHKQAQRARNIRRKERHATQRRLAAEAAAARKKAREEQIQNQSEGSTGS